MCMCNITRVHVLRYMTASSRINPIDMEITNRTGDTLMVCVTESLAGMNNSFFAVLLLPVVNAKA